MRDTSWCGSVFIKSINKILYDFSDEFSSTYLDGKIYHMSFSSVWTSCCSVTCRSGQAVWHFFSGEKAYCGQCSLNEEAPEMLKQHLIFLSKKTK